MRTLASMEKALRAALLDARTVLHLKQLDHDTLAWVEYHGKRVEVAIDPARGGLIECVVHELLHAVYSQELARWGVFEEAIVLGVEREVMARINSQPARVRWWRDAIAKKLQAGEDD